MTQCLSAPWCCESVVATESGDTQPTESNYCVLLSILPGVKEHCMTCLNRGASAPLTMAHT